MLVVTTVTKGGVWSVLYVRGNTRCKSSLLVSTVHAGLLNWERYIQFKMGVFSNFEV